MCLGEDEVKVAVKRAGEWFSNAADGLGQGQWWQQHNWSFFLDAAIKNKDLRTPLPAGSGAPKLQRMFSQRSTAQDLKL